METILLKLSRNLEKKEFLNQIFRKILNSEKSKELYNNLVRQRLYYSGEDSEGNKLQTDIAKSQGKDFYSKYTEKQKKKKGQKTQPVTLRDSGEFYNSIEISATDKDFLIIAEFEKQNGNMFENFRDSYNDFNEFETLILSLNKNELKIFETELKILFVSELKNEIQNEISKLK